jgi:peptidoglycan hydrolase-like protein with peptidoglycan-binding domain
MRVLILAISVIALSVAGILACADAAKASPSTADRTLSISADPAIFTEKATQESEDQIRLDKRKRREVQRRLTGLGFDANVNGKFDDRTRAVITRWQGARGYPETGFLNALQHEALLTENVSEASASLSNKSEDDHPIGHRGAHHSRGGGVGGPVRLIGGMVGGLFGHR